MTMNAITKAEGDKLALIKRTVAKECNDDEFRLFIHMCQAVRLDPLRRQAHAFVFNKSDEAKRQLTVVTSIGGYRSIADRTGNYRPDAAAPRYTMGEKNAKTNPLGIESCEVTVYKFSHGEWWPVVGQAFWDEYVPLTAAEGDVEWVDTGKVWEDSGKPKMKKVVKQGSEPVIDPSKQGWIKMPRIMIAKCAEAAALRKAWPDDFANIHAEEEVHREQSLDAIEAIEHAEQIDRMARIGGPDTYIIDWLDGNELRMVPGGQLHDQVMAFIASCKDEPSTVKAFRDRNKHSLASFWVVHKSDALNLKKAFEKAEATTVEDGEQLDIVDAIAAKVAAQ